MTEVVEDRSELREGVEVRARAQRVLVVDDSEVIRRLIAVNLELEGFEVFLAEDGQECLDVVEAVAPDVITLDVVMPRLDGFSTAARLRSGRATRGVADRDGDRVRAGERSGAGSGVGR